MAVEQPSGRGPKRRHVPYKTKRGNVLGIYWSGYENGPKLYYVRFTDSDGKKKYDSQKFERVEDARTRQREIGDKLHKRVVVIPKAQRFEDVAETYLDQLDVEPRTKEGYEGNLRKHVIPHFGRWFVRDISAEAIIAWRKDLRLQESTKNMVMVPFRQVLEFGGSNVMSEIPRKQQKRWSKVQKQEERSARPLSSNELGRLLAACEGFTWLRPLLQIGVGMGLRLSEILALRWCDVDFERNVLHVQHSLRRDRTLGPTKTPASRRSIDLLPETRALLVERVTPETIGTEEFTFPNGTGQARHQRDVERAFEKARDKAGIPDVIFHDTRDTFASVTLNDGAKSLVWVSKHLGHSDASITLKKYAGLIRSAQHAEAASAQLSEEFGSLLSA